MRAACRRLPRWVCWYRCPARRSDSWRACRAQPSAQYSCPQSHRLQISTTRPHRWQRYSRSARSCSQTLQPARQSLPLGRRLWQSAAWRPMVDPGNLPATRMVSRPVSSRCFFPLLPYHRRGLCDPPLRSSYGDMARFPASNARVLCFSGAPVMLGSLAPSRQLGHRTHRSSTAVFTG